MDIESVDEGPPRRGREQAAQHAKRRGLAGAVRSEKAHDLAAWDLEAHAVDRLDHAVALHEVLRLDRDRALRSGRRHDRQGTSARWPDSESLTPKTRITLSRSASSACRALMHRFGPACPRS